MNKKEALDILHLKGNPDYREIKKSYRALSKILHPDVTKDDGKLFLELKRAHDYLINYKEEKEESKKEYTRLFSVYIENVEKYDRVFKIHLRTSERAVFYLGDSSYNTDYYKKVVILVRWKDFIRSNYRLPIRVRSEKGQHGTILFTNDKIRPPLWYLVKYNVYTFLRKCLGLSV